MLSQISGQAMTKQISLNTLNCCVSCTLLRAVCVCVGAQLQHSSNLHLCLTSHFPIVSDLKVSQWQEIGLLTTLLLNMRLPFLGSQECHSFSKPLSISLHRFSFYIFFLRFLFVQLVLLSLGSCSVKPLMLIFFFS